MHLKPELLRKEGRPLGESAHCGVERDRNPGGPYRVGGKGHVHTVYLLPLT